MIMMIEVRGGKFSKSFENMGGQEIQRKKAKKSQRRLKGEGKDLKDVHRRYTGSRKEDSKKNQRRLTQESKEAHARFKRGSK